MENNKLSVEILKRGSVWFDAGTPESLLRAGQFVETYEKQSGTMLGCIEEAALVRQFVSKKTLNDLITLMPESDYKKYLKKLK